MPMLLRVDLEVVPSLLPAPDLDPLAKPVGRRDLEFEFGDDTEHADSKLRRVE
jgi:hypothetical protein